MRYFVGPLAAVILLCAEAPAQSRTGFVGQGDDPDLPPPSGDSLNGALGGKQDYGTLFVIPDALKVAADGADDAPSIRRAQATGKPVRFLCRHYAIKSPSVITTVARWQGCGWPEMVPTGGGTWFDLDASFQVGPAAGANSTEFAFRFRGPGAAGSVVDGIAVSQPQAAPAPGVTAWQPAHYPHVFATELVTGRVRFSNLLFYGIDNGIYSYRSGRTELDHVTGQVFSNLLLTDQAYDVNRITDVHLFPFWADSTAVLQFQQASLDVVISARSDTPFFTRFFALGARSGIRFSDRGSGVTTGAMLSGIQCDFVQSCLWVDGSAYGAQFQADMVRSFSERFARAPQFASGSIAGNTLTVTAIGDGFFSVGDAISGDGIAAGTAITARGTGTGGLGTYTVSVAQNRASGTLVGATPISMLPGASALLIDGQGVVQLGSLEDFGSERATVALTNGNNASTVQLGSVHVQNVQFNGPNASLVFGASVGSGPAHAVRLGLPPTFVGTKPGGYRYLNNGSNAVVQAPSMTALSP